jgi:hypothetical protein
VLEYENDDARSFFEKYHILKCIEKLNLSMIEMITEEGDPEKIKLYDDIVEILKGDLKRDVGFEEHENES